jgi:signal transduction histidine kinase/CheY-like chemotaxis protein
MRIPISWKIGLLATIPVITTAFIAGKIVYDRSMDLLYFHEEVDLRDETRLRGATIQSHIVTLRQDVLTLASSPVIRTMVESWEATPEDGSGRPTPLSEQSAPGGAAAGNAASRDEAGDCLRTQVRMEFERAATHASRKGASERVKYKPYLRIRLVDAKGREQLRLERASPNGTDGFRVFSFAETEGSTNAAAAPAFEVSETDYFQQAERLETDPPAAPAAGAARAYLSEVGLEPGTESAEARQAVMHAWVPLFSLRGAFAGLVVIDLDFDLVSREISGSARHLVYVTNSDGHFLVHPERNKEFVWLRSNVASETDEQPTCRIQHQVQFANLKPRENDTLASFVESYDPKKFHADRMVPTFGGFDRPELEYRGWKISDHDSPFRPRQDAFCLAVIQKPAGMAQATWVDLAERIDALKAELPDLRASPPDVVESEAAFPIAMASRERMYGKIFDVLAEDYGADFRDRYVKYIADCETFAAYFFRLYFDPSDADRYLGMVMAFSYEEMEAELADTRRAIIWSVVILTALVGAVAVAFSQLLSRRIVRINKAADQIAAGDFDVSLPAGANDELGDLARGFRYMINEVRERESQVRRTNEQLEQLNEKLEQRVSERTAELQKAMIELRAAWAKAQELSQAKDAFLASVSHELRNPLNQVTGFCQLLEMTPLDDAQRGDLGKIRAAADRLLALINDILDYQKIIMGGITLEPEDHEVVKILGEVEEAGRIPAEINRNRLQVDCGEGSGSFFADKRRVVQILVNLVSNACKFTSEGNVWLRARRESDNGNQWIVFTVKDTGRGMTDEEQLKLFTPFTKLSASQGNRTGTGLGLVISKGFCELMRGDIRVVSEYGKGTTFQVRLPARPEDEIPLNDEVGDDSGAALPEVAAKVPVPDLAALSVPETPATEAHSPRSPLNRTVLVIDDDPAVREMMQRYLSHRGFHVVTADGGRKGIEMARSLQPAVITLDVMMPELDGWGVLAALKTDEQTSSIPVIMVTITNNKERGQFLGAEEFLSKPVDWKRLAAVLARYADNDRDRNIMIVEDEASTREILRRSLERDGWTVTEAEHGAQALELLEHEAPAAIILDLMMPVLDGFEFIERYSQKTDRPSIPIIVLTAMDPTPAERERLSGMTVRVLQKGSYSLEELLKEIHRRVDYHVRVEHSTLDGGECQAGG